MPTEGVDGRTLREWRESRFWDVPRMARELIEAARAAGEPVTTTTASLMHSINAWERNNPRADRNPGRPPSPRYLLLYQRIFPHGANGAGKPAQARAAALSARYAALPGEDDIRALAAAASA